MSPILWLRWLSLSPYFEIELDEIHKEIIKFKYSIPPNW